MKAFTIIITIFLFSITNYSQNGQKIIAITIDDLPFVEDNMSINETEFYTDLLLESLSKNNICALGFVNERKLFDSNGIFLQDKLSLLEKWLKKGMQLGNHTFSHPDLSSTKAVDFCLDIEKGYKFTSTLLSQYNQKLKYFRYPFNHTGITKESKDSVEEYLKKNDYLIAPFTIEHSDYMFNDAYHKAKLLNDTILISRIKEEYINFIDTAFSFHEMVSLEYFGYQPPHIFLIHANELNSICMKDIINKISSRGYKFISFDDAIKDKVYSLKDDYIGKYGISWLHRWTVALGLKMHRKGEADPPQFIIDLFEK